MPNFFYESYEKKVKIFSRRIRKTVKNWQQERRARAFTKRLNRVMTWIVLSKGEPIKLVGDYTTEIKWALEEGNSFIYLPYASFRRELFLYAYISDRKGRPLE